MMSRHSAFYDALGHLRICFEIRRLVLFSPNKIYFSLNVKNKRKLCCKLLYTRTTPGLLSVSDRSSSTFIAYYHGT